MSEINYLSKSEEFTPCNIFTIPGNPDYYANIFSNIDNIISYRALKTSNIIRIFELFICCVSIGSIELNYKQILENESDTVARMFKISRIVNMLKSDDPSINPEELIQIGGKYFSPKKNRLYDFFRMNGFNAVIVFKHISQPVVTEHQLYSGLDSFFTDKFRLIKTNITGFSGNYSYVTTIPEKPRITSI